MSTVAQDVTGSGNLFTAAGDVIQVNHHLDRPTAEDHRNLANLLGHVKRTWITDVLEHSVHEAVMLELGMREEKGAVDHPWARVLETPAEVGEVLPADRSIGQVFEQVGRLLLILGEPGSGKTTTLLTLTRECVRQAERDPTAPVPVVFSLSTWAESRRTIHDWLVGELAARYFVGRPLARRWIEQGRLLLFLDGLDEVAENRRAECVQAIHAFVAAHGVPGMVVCSRSQEYRALPVRLKLGGAVTLLPLTAAQVDNYLHAAGAELSSLRGALARSPELLALAESPLMLSIMALTFRGAPPEALRFENADTPAALRDRIFSVYVDRMFARRGHDQPPPLRQRAEGSLRWLARGMAAGGQAVFSIELLQPSMCLSSWKQLCAYTLVSRVAVTLVLMATVCGLMGGLRYWIEAGAVLKLGAIAGVVTGVLCSGMDYLRLRAPRAGRVAGAKRIRMIGGFLLYAAMGIAGYVAAAAILLEHDTTVVLVLPLPSAFAFAFVFCVKQGRGDPTADIGSAGVLGWHWKAALIRAVQGCLFGLLLLGISVAMAPPFSTNRQDLLVAGGVWGGAGGTIGLLFGGWRFQVPEIDLRPGRRRGRRLRGALKGTVFSVLLGALSGGLIQVAFNPESPEAFARFAVFGAISAGLVGFLWLGGIDLILHASLRLVLTASGAAPLHLRRFLDQAVAMVFLRRAGGGYMFIHRLLLEHFAAGPSAGALPPREPPRAPVGGSEC